MKKLSVLFLSLLVFLYSVIASGSTLNNENNNGMSIQEFVESFNDLELNEVLSLFNCQEKDYNIDEKDGKYTLLFFCSIKAENLEVYDLMLTFDSDKKITDISFNLFNEYEEKIYDFKILLSKLFITKEHSPIYKASEYYENFIFDDGVFIMRTLDTPLSDYSFYINYSTYNAAKK